MENTFLDQVHGKLIISCQALEGEPLHSSFIMARMARAAKMAGAPAIRANSVVDIQAIQDETGLPIIGGSSPRTEVGVVATRGSTSGAKGGYRSEL